jgi:hypothetical protein
LWTAKNIARDVTRQNKFRNSIANLIPLAVMQVIASLAKGHGEKIHLPDWRIKEQAKNAGEKET